MAKMIKDHSTSRRLRPNTKQDVDLRYVDKSPDGKSITLTIETGENRHMQLIMSRKETENLRDALNRALSHNRECTYTTYVN